MSKLVIYHASCSDGFCCAWLMHQIFPDAEYLPMHHGSKFTADVEGKTVYLLDFSFKQPEMIELITKAKQVIVLDHHATAEKNLAHIADAVELREDQYRPYVVFDMNSSGGRLTWEYLRKIAPEHSFTKGKSPWLVDYTEDRDLWKFELKNSKAVNAFIRSYPMTFDKWNEFHRYIKPGYLNWKELVIQGEAILRYQEEVINSHVKHAVPQTMFGFPDIPVVNCTTLTSDVVGTLAIGKPFAVGYFDRADGKRQFSLRSDPMGVDVSDLAKTMGGGGHPHAAGYEVDTNSL